MSDRVAQIQAAYAAEQARGVVPVTEPDELPLAYEAITTEWLTAVLCGEVADAAVTDVALDVRDDGSSNRRRIHLQYNRAGQAARLPTTLFCKASHDLPNRIVLGLSGGAHSETHFYRKLRPLLSIEAPRCYFTSFDPQSFNSLVMLEDLTDSVQTFCNDRTPIDRGRAESQIDLLATLHGQGYGKPEIRAQLAPLPTWPEFFQNTLSFGMKEGSEQGFQSAKAVIPPRLFARHREIWSATQASVERHHHLPQTLTHGDVHLKNWYVAGSGAMGLGDWQCCSRGHWGRDVAYTISTALRVDDRRAWEQDLLRRYLDGLAAAGGPHVGFDEAWLHYRQQLMTALTWWTITLAPAPGMPDMQPRDTTLAFIARIATAMDDVDTLDSF